MWYDVVKNLLANGITAYKSRNIIQCFLKYHNQSNTLFLSEMALYISLDIQRTENISHMAAHSLEVGLDRWLHLGFTLCITCVSVC